MQKQTQLFLLTGFLGSGKTSLLQNLLQDLSSQGRRVGVIMNEFGKLGIDGPIIQRDGLALVELNRGSIFCSCLQLSFVSALVDLADRDLDYLFVESSGLADPANIGYFLQAVEVAKGPAYLYKGSICMIDGVNFLSQVDQLETLRHQIEYCELAIISKVDLISDQVKAAVKQRILQTKPQLTILEVVKGQLDFASLTRELSAEVTPPNQETTNSPDNKPKTLTLTYSGPASQDQLSQFLDQIKSDSYRIKGFFKLDQGWSQVDVVGQRIDYLPIPDRQTSSELVIISKIGPNLIRPIFSAWDQIFPEQMTLR